MAVEPHSNRRRWAGWVGCSLFVLAEGVFLSVGCVPQNPTVSPHYPFVAWRIVRRKTPRKIARIIRYCLHPGHAMPHGTMGYFTCGSEGSLHTRVNQRGSGESMPRAVSAVARRDLMLAALLFVYSSTYSVVTSWYPLQCPSPNF